MCAGEHQLSIETQRFSMPSPPLDMKAVKSAAKEDRKFAIDAAIVRVAKTRKAVKQSQLISEVMQHLRNFSPSGRNIKLRISSLIDREYLERSEEDSTQILYVA